MEMGKATAPTLVNWENFKESAGSGFQPEAGRKYKLSFSAIKEGTVKAKEEIEDGSVIEKTIPCLILGVDSLDGAKVALEFRVTSKRLAQQMKTYYEEKMLFSRIFSLEKTGVKFSTKYQLTALGDKPRG